MGKKRDRRHRRRGLTTAKATPAHNATSAMRERPKVEPAPELEEGKRWHVVRTNIKCEQRAELGLKGQGFITYRPRYSEKRARRGKVTEVERQLFPRYLFVGFGPGDSWFPILKTDGVEALLRSRTSFEPIAIPTFWVKGLAEEAEEALAPEPPPVLIPGQIVRVESGPFASFEAEVMEIQSEHKARILVSLFGRLTPVDVPLNAIAVP